jgi:outer membrane murein-binding lipoprotein Lpp
MEEGQTLDDVKHLDAELDQAIKKVDRLKSELAAAEAELEQIRQANMRARRIVITGEPPTAQEVQIAKALQE